MLSTNHQKAIMRRLYAPVVAVVALALLLALSLQGCGSSDKVDPQEQNSTDFVADTDPVHKEIMSNSWWFWYDEMRDPDTFLYCDKVNTRNVGVCSKAWVSSRANPLGYSSASVGWGIVLLVVGLEMGYITDVVDTANEVETVVRRVDAYWPRGPGRFITHWARPNYTLADYKNSPYTGMGEVSTIDTAILALGAAFAANYFEQKYGISTVVGAVNDFVAGVDWAFAIKPTGVLLDAAKPNVARSFNEYYMVAYLANLQLGSTNAAVHLSYETNWVPVGDARPVGSFTPVMLTDSSDGSEIPLLGGNGWPMSSFVPQFPAFLCQAFARNSYWQKVVGDYLEGDMAWWRDEMGASDVFGNGPGQSPDNIYAVDKVNKANPTKTFSAAIMAGFFIAEQSTANSDLSAERAKIHQLLDNLWNSTTYGGAPMMTKTKRKILWRSSVARPTWTPNLIVMDYANFPLGYAVNFLGRDFYSKFSI